MIDTLNCNIYFVLAEECKYVHVGTSTITYVGIGLHVNTYLRYLFNTYY